MGSDEVMDDFFLGGGYGKHSNRGNGEGIFMSHMVQTRTRVWHSIRFIRYKIPDHLSY
jgi:hypothetical protein